MPGRAATNPLSSSQRSELTSEDGSNWDSLRSALNRSMSSLSSIYPSLQMNNRIGQSTGSRVGSAYDPAGYTPAASVGSGSGYTPVIGSAGPSGGWSGGSNYSPGGQLAKFSQESQGRISATAYARMMEEMQRSQYGGYTDASGVGSPSGSKWAAVNQWNAMIQTAINRVAQEFGIRVPANVVKAVMQLESQGNMVGCNSSGYCGLMQTGPGSNVQNYNHSYNMTPEGNLYYGVQELANWYRVTGDWNTAPLAYFSGYNYNKPWVTDANGTTVAGYNSIIQQNLSELNAATSFSGGTGYSPSGYNGPQVTNQQYANSALSTMFQGYYPRQTGFGFGYPTNPSGSTYLYGQSYGTNGHVHTGLDVPMPLGAAFYAPAAATVSCIGCYRNDHITNGIGRIELTMPDGARVLYDHTYGAAAGLRVGQRVSAGQLLGYSGGMTYPHIHLEVRVPDRSMASGYRLVDPEQYFAGMGGQAIPWSGGFASKPAQSATDRLRQLMGL